VKLLIVMAPKAMMTVVALVAMLSPDQVTDVWTAWALSWPSTRSSRNGPLRRWNNPFLLQHYGEQECRRRVLYRKDVFADEVEPSLCDQKSQSNYRQGTKAWRLQRRTVPPE